MSRTSTGSSRDHGVGHFYFTGWGVLAANADSVADGASTVGFDCLQSFTVCCSFF